MIRPLAASFAALAMAITIVRGAMTSELAIEVIERSLVFAIVYAVIGGLAGWLLDTQIRSSVQGEFEQRVQWYREGMDRWISIVHPKLSPKQSELLARAQGNLSGSKQPSNVPSSGESGGSPKPENIPSNGGQGPANSTP